MNVQITLCVCFETFEELVEIGTRFCPRYLGNLQYTYLGWFREVGEIFGTECWYNGKDDGPRKDKHDRQYNKDRPSYQKSTIPTKES